MLWMKQATFAYCLHFGSKAMLASTLGFALTCNAPLQSSAPQPVAHKPTTTFASAQPEKHELLPQPKPIENPLPPPVNCAIEPCLALTFDDGPDARTTPQLLDTLAAHQVKATFFMLGSQVVKHPDIVKRAVADGHEIGNHSWIHGNFTKMSPEQMLEDINHTQAALQNAGAPPPRLFRPPYGARNDAVRNTIPLSLAIWNVDPEDWHAPNPAELAARIVATAKPGGIIVLHDIKPVTVAAATHFVPELKKTYRLVTTSQLLNITPESPKAEYRGR